MPVCRCARYSLPIGWAVRPCPLKSSGLFSTLQPINGKKPREWSSARNDGWRAQHRLNGPAWGFIRAQQQQHSTEHGTAAEQSTNRHHHHHQSPHRHLNSMTLPNRPARLSSLFSSSPLPLLPGNCGLGDDEAVWRPVVIMGQANCAQSAVFIASSKRAKVCLTDPGCPSSASKILGQFPKGKRTGRGKCLCQQPQH